LRETTEPIVKENQAMERVILSQEEETRIRDDLQAFHANCLWIRDHYESLLDQFEDQWVAVLNEQVIASDKDFFVLAGQVSDRLRTCVEYITREPLEMIL
jgi:hypothetical protein